MRLSCFQANQIEPQLLIDLTKIYNISLVQAQDLVEDANQALFVAMFNDRHIAACKIKKSGATAQLVDFTVRDLTRRRGVGKFLLSQLEQTLAAEGIRQVELTDPNQASIAAFAAAMGYTFDQHVWTKAL
ncbi:aspartate 1-decarboxylase autocleavage activator PanM [Motilimonas pumila]|uniref:Aspartate 1-decarboxylase autocleavage activator PanM n=1 Tax=Motilimonas pumila TaxID=2303987 RepID=A0A418YKT7_9GAMM|nr:aspartate 1-decarboxylase autocleavage activator PanM [Motilimonas pumila]RJG51592.1 aspartate 1-decarboxylase autocleavage activator PanM [Motilimonas pumila]